MVMGGDNGRHMGWVGGGMGGVGPKADIKSSVGSGRPPWGKKGELERNQVQRVGHFLALAAGVYELPVKQIDHFRATLFSTKALSGIDYDSSRRRGHHHHANGRNAELHKKARDKSEAIEEAVAYIFINYMRSSFCLPRFICGSML